MNTWDFDPAKLRHIRKKLSLTQAQFAKHAGVSQSFVAKLEAGRLDPTYSKVKQVTGALDRLTHQEEQKAADLMTRDVVCARVQDAVSDLVSLMARKSISQLPVMEGHHAVGLITEGAILEAQSRKPLAELKGRDVMTDAPPTVSPATPSSAVLALLRFFSAVLVAKDNRVLGIITKSDLLKAAVQSPKVHGPGGLAP